MLLEEMGVQPPPPPMPDLGIFILGDGGAQAVVLPGQEPEIDHGLAAGGAEESFERRRSSPTGLHRLGGSTQAAVRMHSDAANFTKPSHQRPSQRRPFEIRCRHINFRFFRKGTCWYKYDECSSNRKKSLLTYSFFPFALVFHFWLMKVVFFVLIVSQP